MNPTTPVKPNPPKPDPIRPLPVRPRSPDTNVNKDYKDVKVNPNPPNCIEVDATREPVSIVFIGHVDHGKSTICGNLMLQMGLIDERTIQKYKKDANE